MHNLDGTVDVQDIYNACMKDETGFRISAAEAGAAREEPFSLYCKYHVDPAKKDPPDPFLEALSAKGREHESDVLESDYPGTEPLRYETLEEGFMTALRSMAGGIGALAEPPLFWLPEGMMGKPDILEKQDGGSALGGHHYVAREIKLTRNIKKPHILQAAFYALMLGHIQRRMPECFRITDGNQSTKEYRYAEYEGVLTECVEQAGRIIRGELVPPAVRGGCGAPWVNFCNETAVQNDDVSLIPGIGASMRDRMVEAGFGTVRSVASMESPAPLQKVRGVGQKKSVDYLDAARAISGGKAVRKVGGGIVLPERSTEIFLDLEGLNVVFDDTLNDYLIGALVRKDGSEKYHSFVAERRREDVMLKEFLDFMDSQSDYVIYHWHSYERSHMRSLMEKHGMESHLRLLEPDVMLDLHKVATGAFAFPTYTNGIKDIAKWLGFEWRHGGDVGATSAIDMYLMYADDPEANREGMQMVIDYNEDDCKATRLIKDWLVSVR